MAIAFRAASSAIAANNATSGTLAPAIPTGTTTNDILLLSVYVYNTGGSAPTISTPTGYTLGATSSTTTYLQKFFWKRAGASESAPSVSYTAGGTTTTECAEAMLYAYSGCTTSGDPTEAVSTAISSNTAATTFAGVAITTTAANRVAIQLYALADNDATQSIDTGYTLESNVTTVLGSDASLLAYDQAVATASTVSAPTLTCTFAGGGGAAYSVVGLALIPDTGATTKTITTSANAATQKTLSKTASADAAVQKSLTKTAGADSAVQKSLTVTTGAEAAVLKTGLTKTSQAEAAVQKSGFTTSAQADATVQTSFSASTGADATVQKSQTVTAGADSAVLKTLTVTAGADSAVLKTGLTTGTGADAAVQKDGFTVSTGADALLTTITAVATNADAAVLATLTKTAQADAAVQGTLSKATSADAAVQGTLTTSAGADAAVQTTFTAATSAESALLKTLLATTSADAVLTTSQPNVIVSVDAVLQAQLLQKNIQIDAVIALPQVETPAGGGGGWPSRRVTFGRAKKKKKTPLTGSFKPIVTAPVRSKVPSTKRQVPVREIERELAQVEQPVVLPDESDDEEAILKILLYGDI